MVNVCNIITLIQGQSVVARLPLTGLWSLACSDYSSVVRAHLQFVPPLVVLQVPAAAGDDHDDLLLAQDGQSSVQ